MYNRNREAGNSDEAFFTERTRQGLAADKTRKALIKPEKT